MRNTEKEMEINVSVKHWVSCLLREAGGLNAPALGNRTERGGRGVLHSILKSHTGKHSHPDNTWKLLSPLTTEGIEQFP